MACAINLSVCVLPANKPYSWRHLQPQYFYTGENLFFAAAGRVLYRLKPSVQKLELLSQADSQQKATAWIPVSFHQSQDFRAYLSIPKTFIPDFESFQAGNFPQKHLPVTSLKSHQMVVHETKLHAPRLRNKWISWLLISQEVNQFGLWSQNHSLPQIHLCLGC